MKLLHSARDDEMIPLSLYIHIPWCVRKCPYCDFNSHATQGELPEKQYIQALIQDCVQQLSFVQHREIKSIFIGGGTPSLFTPEAYQTLFHGLAQLLNIAENAEITLEANPGTVEAQHFSGYREVGINRLSLGIQSLQDEKLKKLGRIHTAEQAHQAITIANDAGFTNFNLDLMFGLPQQSIADALYDLQQAIQHQPTHLSWYQLTIEPNTYFYRHTPILPEDDLIWEMQQQGQALLAKKGFNQYEVSAYAQANKRCQHNLNYWQFGDYIGIGAGAHSKVTLFAEQKIQRHWNYKSPHHYLDPNKPFIANAKVIPENELPLEYMMNVLRLYQSFSVQDFEAKTSCKWSAITNIITEATTQGLLAVKDSQITTTTLGKRFLNNLLELF